MSVIPIRWEDWHAEALCANSNRYDPNLWHAEEGSRKGQGGTMETAIRRAKAVCAQCPVRRECLTSAIENSEEWGIWGGHLPREREKAPVHDRYRCPKWGNKKARCSGCIPPMARVMWLEKRFKEYIETSNLVTPDEYREVG